MFCPRCHAEYAQGFTRCSDCDVDLVEELPLAATPRYRPPTPPDVSVYMSHSDRPGPLARYALLWFLGLPLVAYLVLALAHVWLVGPASVATGLAALLVCWTGGRRPDVPARFALRLLVFAVAAAGYALTLPLILHSYHGHVILFSEVRKFLPLALVAGLLAQALLSPNAALRRLAQPFIRWRGPWYVYVVALFSWPVLTLLIVELSRHLPGAQHGVAQGGFISTMLRIGLFDVLVLGPWAVAWFGYGVPMLLRRHSALTTGLAMGVLTWLQLGIPALVQGQLGGLSLYLDLGIGLPVAVVAVWLFQRAGSSVWPVLLLQATTATSLLLDWAGDGFGGGDYGAWAALVAAEAAFAAALVVLGHMWVRPRDVAAGPRPDGPQLIEDQHAALVQERC